MNIKNLVELGAGLTANMKTEQAAPNHSQNKDNAFLQDMQRAVEKSERQTGAATKTQKKKSVEDAMAAQGIMPQEDSKNIENEQTLETDETQTKEQEPQEAAADPAILAIMAQLLPVAQQPLIVDVQDAQEHDATQLNIVVTDVNMEAQAQAQPYVILPEAPATLAGDMQEPEAMEATTQDATFAERVLGQIQQAVVSNEAERTVSAQPQQAEQEATQLTRPSEYDPNKKTVEPEKGNAEADATVQPIIPARPGVTAEVAIKEGAIAPPATQQPLFDSILEQVQTAVTEQQSELYIQLKPDVLGGLSIRLVMTDEGLSAQVRTSNQQLQTMVHAQIAQLEANLRDKGIQVVQMDVIYDQSTSNQYLDQQQRQWREEGSGQQNGRRHVTRVIEEIGSLTPYEQLYESMVPTETIEAEGVEYSA